MPPLLTGPNPGLQGLKQLSSLCTQPNLELMPETGLCNEAGDGYLRP